MKRIRYFTVLLLFFILHITANAAGNEPVWPATPSVDVFISLSMPEPSLLLWQEEAKRYHARLVIRGFVKDSLQETIKALTLAKDNVLEVSIDPILFRQYGLKEVPAVVLSDGVRYDVVYGNTSLTAALETIAREGELHEVAKRVLKHVKEEHYV